LEKEAKHPIHEPTRKKHEIRPRDFVKFCVISWIVPKWSFFTNLQEMKLLQWSFPAAC